MISFPAAPHDDQVDAFTQALAYLRTSTFDSAEWQQVGAMQLAYHAARRRGAPAYGEMVMNAAIWRTSKTGRSMASDTRIRVYSEIGAARGRRRLRPPVHASAYHAAAHAVVARCRPRGGRVLIVNP